MASKSDGDNHFLRVALRPMTEEDIPVIHPIELASYTSPWPVSCFEGELRINRFARYIVAEAPGAVVIGYAGIWITGDEGHITTVAVNPDYRRRKVAEQMLVDMMEYALRRRVVAIFLEVRRHNLPAQKLYSRYRYVPVRVRQGYYSDNGEDAIELRVPDTRDQKFIDNFIEQRRTLREMLGEDRQD